MTYKTEAFLPHLREIRSLEDFQRYAPYRADYRMVLSVHPEDMQDAYGVLRELEVRLSALQHPDQHWWKDASSN
jgi:hypothetical protein